MSPPSSSSRHRGRREPNYGSRQSSGRSYTTLLITNIGNKEHPSDVKESLEFEFNKYGDNSVRVTVDRSGDQVAYATFRSPSDARVCKNARGMLLLKDRRLRIDPVYDDDFVYELDRRSVTPPRRSRSPQYFPRHQKGQGRHKMTSRGRSGSYDDRRHDDRKYGSKYSPPGRGYGGRGTSRDYSPPARSGKRQSVDYDESRSRSPSRDYSPPDKGMGDNFGAVDEALMDPEFYPPEDDANATRTLFVGNLEVHMNPQDVRKKFEKYGYVETVDFKKTSRNGNVGSYCFVRYGNLDMAYRAKLSLNGKPIYQQPMHIGYGKIIASVRVWVGGLGPWTKLADLEQEFDRFGSIKRIDYHRGETCAAILYETTDAAKEACTQMRGFLMPNAETRLKMDFLDPDSEEGSYRDIPDHKRRPEPRRMEYRGRGGYRGRGRGGYRGGDGGFERRGYKNQSPPPYAYDSPKRQGPSSKKPSSAFASARNPAKAEMQYKHNNAKTCYDLHDLCHCFSPTCWQGGFVLKNVHFPVHFYLLDGDMGIFNITTADPTSPTGRRVNFDIHHRLKLDEQRMEVIRKRLDRQVCKDRSCLVLAVPGFPTDLQKAGEKNEQIIHKPLRGLVKYFKDKGCAAVVKLPLLTRSAAKEDDDEMTNTIMAGERKLSGVLHAFPPSAFVTEQLLKIGPSLQPKFFLDEYMLLYLVKGPQSIVV